MMQAETKTAVGVFSDYRTAEQVVQELTAANIPRENIKIESNFRTGAAGGSSTFEGEKEGGISGFFHNLFGGKDEDDTRDENPEYGGHYAEAVRRGSAVVCVRGSDDQIEEAVQIMNDNDAIDIDRRLATFKESGYERHNPEAAPFTHDEAEREREQYRDMENGGAIPVVEEELQIGKRTVRRGGVRVFSHVVEEPVEQDVELREEHVRVERRPVNRPVEAGTAERFRNQSIEVAEMAEEAVVEKRARVREEVVVSKETTQKNERIKDTVKRTKVEVGPIERDGGDSREPR